MRNRISPWEIIALVAIMALFLGINFTCSERAHRVWGDEVIEAEPGVNLALGHGFTSSVSYLPDNQFYIGLRYAHSFLVALSVKLFGFGMRSVRGINYLLVACSAFLIWLRFWRSGWVRSASLRVLLLGLVLCGYGINFCYRTGRSDGILIFLCTLLFFVTTNRAGRARHAWQFLICFLIAYTALQGLFYLAILGTILLLFYKRPFLWDFIAIGSGCFLGLLTYAIALKLTGRWETLLSLLALARQSAPLTFGQKLASHVSAGGLIRDPSMIILNLLVVGWLVRGIGKRERPITAATSLALATGILLPLVFLIFFKDYPIYYSWMAYLPASIILVRLVDAHGRNGFGGLSKAAMGLAIAAGLPLWCVLILLQWDLRDYRPVEDFISRNIKAGEAVCAERFEPYYALKAVTPKAMVGQLYTRHGITEAQKQEITALITGMESGPPPAMRKRFGRVFYFTEAYRMPVPTGGGILSRIRRVDLPEYSMALYRDRPSPPSPSRDITRKGK